jgi:molecular chaperone GrpE
MSDKNKHPRTNGAAADAATETKARTRAEERIAALDDVATTEAAAPTPVEEPFTVGDVELAQILERLVVAEQQVAENAAGWQRERADFLNYRRRTEDELARARDGAGDGLIRRMLGVADDFDRAIEHIPADQTGSAWVEGIAAIDRKLRQQLEAEGVLPIEAVGKPFDPREHEAVTLIPTTEAADGTVLRELQRGYYLRDRVLRPALVAVATNDEQAT